MYNTPNRFDALGTDEAKRRAERFAAEYGFKDAGVTGGRASVRRLVRRGGSQTELPGERERPPHADHDELIIADVGVGRRKPPAYVMHLYASPDGDGTLALSDGWRGDIEAFAEQYGLDVDFRPDLSWYKPDSTVAVIFTLAGGGE